MGSEHIPAVNELPTAKTHCPSCKHAISYYDIENSSYYVCGQCNCYFRHEHEEPPVALRKIEESSRRLYFKIGDVCTIKGKRYILTGIQVRRSKKSYTKWTEYFLKGTEEGYTVLVETDTEWTLVNKLPQIYEAYKKLGHVRVKVNGRVYLFETKNQPVIVSAQGEFDWNIFDDEQIISYEFYNEYGYVIEEDCNGTFTWYLGTPVSRADVAKMFDVPPARLPHYRRTDNVDMTALKHTNRKLLNFSAIAVGVFLLITLLIGYLKPANRLLLETYVSSVDSTGWSNKPIVTSRFHVEGPTALGINLASAISNEWLEISGTLVNEKTGESYDFTKSLEYYHGYEDGESWSEGSHEEVAVLSNIPTGDYHLNLYPYMESRRAVEITTEVSQNEFLTSNMLVTLLAIVIYPAVRRFYQHYLENN